MENYFFNSVCEVLHAVVVIKIVDKLFAISFQEFWFQETYML